jgi:hypothetical protein
MRVTMKKIMVIVLVIVTFILLTGLTGCGSGSTASSATSTAVLSEATTCRSFNNQTGPGDKTAVFSKTDLWITCAMKISDAPAGTLLTAKWFKGGSSSSFYEKTFDVRGTGYYSIRYEKQHATYDTGDYSIKLYLNGSEKAVVKFTIQ